MDLVENENIGISSRTFAKGSWGEKLMEKIKAKNMLLEQRGELKWRK